MHLYLRKILKIKENKKNRTTFMLEKLINNILNIANNESVILIEIFVFKGKSSFKNQIKLGLYNRFESEFKNDLVFIFVFTTDFY